MGERASQSLDETSYRQRQWSKVTDPEPRWQVREQFSSVAAGTGIKELKTPYRAPKANAFSELAIGSMKRECLDHVLVLHQRQCGRIVKEYMSYYDDARPHQGIQQRSPRRYDETSPNTIRHRVESDLGWTSSRLFSHYGSELGPPVKTRSQRSRSDCARRRGSGRQMIKKTV